MGSADRIARMFSAILIVCLYVAGLLPGEYGILALILAFAFFVTSLSGICPLYKVVHISTCPVE